MSMENAVVVRIPKERIAVLIGKEGRTKSDIEKKGQVELEIDSEEGEVTILQKGDALKAVIAQSVVQATGRGFNPKVAALLFEENAQLIMISLRDFAKPGSRRINQIRGRIIGRNGRTRQIIEELTSTYISVYGDTVSIIGDYLSVQTAKEAINMLVQGRKHRSVYNYLERSAKELRVKRIEESFQ